MKKFLIIAALIAIAAIIINYSLGGFKTITPELISSNQQVIYGKAYEGSYNSELLDELMLDLRGSLAGSNNQGQLVIVNYIEPELEKRGTVKQFLGIIWADEPENNDYDSLIIGAYNGVQFTVPVQPLVMPSPEKMQGLAEDFAMNMQSTLAGFSIEQYQDKTLVINFPFE